ncbi:MAG: hypothetical protein E7583_10345 [Ruminococcaceae bacterium]|nr:hypothetical protein [Oscillospiraceae bacterium]
MTVLNFNNMTIKADLEKGCITSVNIFGKEIASGQRPLFTVYLRYPYAEPRTVNAFDAKKHTYKNGLYEYSGFEYDITVKIKVPENENDGWSIRVENNTDMLIEWVTFPEISLKPLVRNGGDARVVCTYNEGALCDDLDKKGKSVLAEYPSQGWYWMFPYMLFGQFMCYQTDSFGLYLAAHDKGRAPKGIDFCGENGNTVMFIRQYTGINYGESYKSEYPIIIKAYRGTWHDGAEIYRRWFTENLPTNVKKISENPAIPEWYKDAPLVITYPVRGIHDMDKMDPNALFPYENALPEIEDIAKKVDSRLLVLLMHWEGTAPWAPPYVWPPYGGEEMFNSFADKLHERNHVLGVYCSGFGFTLQSNLCDEYNNADRIEKEGLKDAFCASPGGVAEISRICTGQRSGYDICAASDKGKKLLDEAYLPLFESRADYCQILDQNHGGSQYFCYSREHGHPHAPGKWMTSGMRRLLDGWNKMGKGKLFGCESASSEPYIGNLLFSDNRYELNWRLGEPIPLYSYIYHEYLRNFMGNQVSCPLTNEKDSMCARMAYSFSAGDCMTIVLTPFGKIMTNWGNHDFSRLPDKDKAIAFAANMQRFYREKAADFLYDGRMIKPAGINVTSVSFPTDQGYDVELPSVYTSAWEKNGEKAQIFVNHTDEDIAFEFLGKTVTVKALDAEIVYF